MSSAGYTGGKAQPRRKTSSKAAKNQKPALKRLRTVNEPKSAVPDQQIAELQSPSVTSEQPIESEPQIIGDWTPSLIPEPGSSSLGSCLESINDPFVVTGLESNSISSISMDSRYSSLGPYLDSIFGPPVVTSPEFSLGYPMNMHSEINPSAASPTIYGSMPADPVFLLANTYSSPLDSWEGSNDVDFRFMYPRTEKDKGRNREGPGDNTNKSLFAPPGRLDICTSGSDIPLLSESHGSR